MYTAATKLSDEPKQAYRAASISNQISYLLRHDILPVFIQHNNLIMQTNIRSKIFSLIEINLMNGEVFIS
jgi:hypothetical protein